MSVTLLRAYSGFISGAIVQLDAATESALVAQGLAVYTGTGSTPPNPPLQPTFDQQAPAGAFTAGAYCPAVVTNIPIGSAALTGFETNGVAQTAFKTNITEIFTPGWNTWTGASYLNGTGVGTDKAVIFLFDTNGKLIANTDIAGTTNAAGASVFEKVPFATPVTLPPGRYFLGLNLNGTTVTPRHVLAAFGAEPRSVEYATATSFAASLATLQAGITVPTSFVTAKAPIMQLYS